MGSIGRDPIFIASVQRRADPDADGNEYVDWVSSWGPLILGHADPEVVRAACDAAARGTSFGAPTEGEVELAAEVARRIPSVEMLRMTSSGTEATMSVIRLARAVTGRERILKFAGAYHGHVDGLLAQAGSGLATQGIPASPGVTEAAAAATVIVPWNDREARDRGDRAPSARGDPGRAGARPTWAWCRPSPSSSSCWPSGREHTGALLVFDEVITRLPRRPRRRPGALRGDARPVDPRQDRRRRLPRGGLRRAPRADGADRTRRATSTRRERCRATRSRSPRRWPRSPSSTTPPTQKLGRTTKALADGLRDAARGRRRSRPGPARHRAADRVLLASGPCTTTPTQRPATSTLMASWCRGLLERGVYPPASQFEAWFPSLVHGEAEIERTVSAAAAAFADDR